MTSDEMAAAAAPPLFPDVTRDDVFRLETRRLWLRWPRVSDVAALADMAGRKEVAEMTGTWLHPLPQGEAERAASSRRARPTPPPQPDPGADRARQAQPTDRLDRRDALA